MTGIDNLNKMKKPFLLIFAISLVVYFVLDFILNNAMLYIAGGVIGGGIVGFFKVLGVNVGETFITLIWLALLTGLITLFYRLRSKILRYITIIVIAIFLYIVDVIVAEMPYPETIGNVTLINNMIISSLVLSKSLILSAIIYYGLDNREKGKSVIV